MRFFDSETIALVKVAFDDACSRLTLEDGNIPRSVLAERILRAAATGERDPVRLRILALTGLQWEPDGRDVMPEKATPSAAAR